MAVEIEAEVERLRTILRKVWHALEGSGSIDESVVATAIDLIHDALHPNPQVCPACFGTKLVPISINYLCSYCGKTSEPHSKYFVEDALWLCDHCGRENRYLYKPCVTCSKADNSQPVPCGACGGTKLLCIGIDSLGGEVTITCNDCLPKPVSSECSRCHGAREINLPDRSKVPCPACSGASGNEVTDA